VSLPVVLEPGSSWGTRFTTYRRALAACAAGMVVLYALGIPYFYFISNYIIDAPIGFWVAVWYCGVLQVLPDFLLCVAAAYIGIRLYKAGLWIRETQEMQVRSSAPAQGAAGGPAPPGVVGEVPVQDVETVASHDGQE